MSDEKKKKLPRGKPFEKGRAKTGGRKKGGRNINLTIPLDVAANLPEQDKEARAVIVSAVREKIKSEQ